MFAFQSIKRIFKDPEMQSNFERNGFVVVDMYSKEMLEKVVSFYHEMHPDKQAGFYPSAYSDNKTYRNRIDQELTQLCKPKLDELFVDFQVMNGCFIVKQPGLDSYLHVHQDMTLVDESRFVGINIWTTTVDLTTTNGVLNQSLVHYSPPNSSKKIRKAITAGLKTKDAQMIFHYRDSLATSDQIEKFEMDDDFFIQFDDFFTDIYNRPSIGKFVGKMNYSVPMLSGDALQDQFSKMRRSAGFEPIENITRISDSKAHTKRSFFETYTFKNMLMEVIGRIKKSN